MKSYREKVRRLWLKNDKLKQQNRQLVSQKEYFKHEGNQKLMFHHLKTSSMYRIALTKSCGNVSAESCNIIMGVAVSGKTVIRCEHLLHANIWGRCVQWYKEMYKLYDVFLQKLVDNLDLFNPRMRRLVSWEIHRIRGDATNSSSIRSFNVFCSEVLSAFHIPQITELEHIYGSEETEQFTDMRLSYPDITYVPCHASAATSKTMWEHQIEKIGAKTWRQESKLNSDLQSLLQAAPDSDVPPELASFELARHLRRFTCRDIHMHINVYLGTTDCGPDEAAFSRLMEDELWHDVLSWVLWTFCFIHQIHLMTKRQLEHWPTYFSGMAKMSNVWRSPKVAAQIYKTWKGYTQNRLT